MWLLKKEEREGGKGGTKKGETEPLKAHVINIAHIYLAPTMPGSVLSALLYIRLSG